MTIELFNITHILTFMIMPVLVYLLLNHTLSKHGDDTKRKALLLVCLLNALLYISYKITQAYDPYYDFDILMDLPLNFCNINLIILPVSILTKNKCLMAYQFYFGTALIFLAMVFVDPAFISRPLYSYTCFVYFLYHSVQLAIAVLLVRFKFFTPSFKAVWQPAIILTAMAFLTHAVNMVFRTTGIAPESNYFYTYGLEGNPFTELFWGILPYGFIYLLPSLLLFAPYVFITTLPFHLSGKPRR